MHIDLVPLISSMRQEMKENTKKHIKHNNLFQRGQGKNRGVYIKMH